MSHGKADAKISPLMRELSSYIAGAMKRKLPKDVSDRAKLHIVDTFAAMISGSRLLPGKAGIAYVKTLGGKPEAGVIGTRKFSYDVWGDPVNLASRLESQSSPGRILICPGCRAKLGEDFLYEARGPIEIKGLGAQETWFLLGERHPSPVAEGGEDPFIPSDRPRNQNAS